MSAIGQRERKTQAHLVRLFSDELGYEYLGHLIEWRHTDRFRSLLDRYLPRWRSSRSLLNEAPLGHADWSY